VVFKGHSFLKKLVLGNCVVAPAGMVRKDCYDKVGVFPLDMPHASDWYLWCMFSLFYDAAYIAEPLVHYRSHDTNLSKMLTKNERHVIAADNIAVRWRLRGQAEQSGYRPIVRLCNESISTHYANLLADKIYENGMFGLTLEECEKSLLQHARNDSDAAEMRARIYTALGDQYYLRRDFASALQYYQESIQQNPWVLGAWMKYTLLRMGILGVLCRDAVSHGLRQHLAVPVPK
jgi:hypothetical protein